MELSVPQAFPLGRYLAHQRIVLETVKRVLERGWYVLGTETESFEREFAQYLGVAKAIGVGNGTDALELCLRGCGVGPGDKVVTVSHTAVATVAAILRIGAVPWLVDVEPGSLCMDPHALEQVLEQDRCAGSGIRAIVPVHLYGRMADMPAIMELAAQYGDVPVIEDCAQATGASWQGRKAGSWGKAAAFSFYPTKNLAAFGDAGMAVTRCDSIAESIHCMRQYGWRQRYISESFGVNSRLDEIHAAVLRVMLPHLDEDNQRRSSLADYYHAAILPSKGRDIRPERQPYPQHVYHQYVVQVEDAGLLQRHLLQFGVSTVPHYPLPVHRMPAFLHAFPGHDQLPVTDTLTGRLLSLPMFPDLMPKQATHVGKLICDWLDSNP
ncbi:MAG: DegT/DnrJ/EryC1/StrS family aminotransferase [Magnetococcales bacterium]|nr:DegT/DnrJ/EryC1/StrS family aminotransferase [Magnetococcales bacterium]